MSVTIANNNISSSGELTINNNSLATVAFSGDYNDLTNRPTTGSGSTVVERWSQGTEWYRVYDDGWIEQGGNVPDGSGITLYTKTFAKPFSDTNYTIVASGEYSEDGRDNRVMAHTATEFKYYHGFTTSAPMRFRACGY